MSLILSQAQVTLSRLDQIKDWSIIAAGVVALTTFWFGLLQYRRENHNRRAEQFVSLRRRFLEDPLFREILNMLPHDDPKLAQISIQDRRNFLGFLEELALMVNSGLIKPEVARYMFGYYVCLANSSVHIWSGLDKESVYWTVFRTYANGLAGRDLDQLRAVASQDLRF